MWRSQREWRMDTACSDNWLKLRMHISKKTHEKWEVEVSRKGNACHEINQELDNKMKSRKWTNPTKFPNLCTIVQSLYIPHWLYDPLRQYTIFVPKVTIPTILYSCTYFLTTQSMCDCAIVFMHEILNICVFVIFNHFIKIGEMKVVCSVHIWILPNISPCMKWHFPGSRKILYIVFKVILLSLFPGSEVD